MYFVGTGQGEQAYFKALSEGFTDPESINTLQLGIYRALVSSE